MNVNVATGIRNRLAIPKRILDGHDAWCKCRIHADSSAIIGNSKVKLYDVVVIIDLLREEGIILGVAISLVEIDLNAVIRSCSLGAAPQLFWHDSLSAKGLPELNHGLAIAGDVLLELILLLQKVFCHILRNAQLLKERLEVELLALSVF